MVSNGRAQKMVWVVFSDLGFGMLVVVCECVCVGPGKARGVFNLFC